MTSTDAQPPLQHGAAGTPDPVFIVGAPRSGVGVLQWALRFNPALWAAEETRFLADLLGTMRVAYRHGSEPGHRLNGVGWEDFASSVGLGVTALIASRSDGRRLVDQTPGYVHHLDDLLAMLPGSSYLFLIRDGRDAVDAMRRQPEPISHAEACREWSTATQAGIRFGRKHPSRLHRVRFEELMATPRRVLTEVHEFLGCDMAPRSLTYLATRPSGASGPPRWQDWTAAERQTFHDIAGGVLIDTGYAREASWAEPAGS